MHRADPVGRATLREPYAWASGSWERKRLRRFHQARLGPSHKGRISKSLPPGIASRSLSPKTLY